MPPDAGTRTRHQQRPVEPYRPTKGFASGYDPAREHPLLSPTPTPTPELTPNPQDVVTVRTAPVPTFYAPGVAPAPAERPAQAGLVADVTGLAAAASPSVVMTADQLRDLVAKAYRTGLANAAEGAAPDEDEVVAGLLAGLVRQAR